MMERLSALWQLVLEIIAEPTANLTSALLLAAAVTTLLLIFVVVAAFFLLPSEDESDTRRSRRRRASAGDGERESDEPWGDDTGDRESVTRDVVLGEPETEPGAELSSTKRASGFGLGAALVPVAVVLLIVAGVSSYVLTSTDRYCLTCHADVADARMPESAGATETVDSVHAGVSCVSCHEAPLPTGIIDNVSSRTRHLVGQALGSQSEAAPIRSDACSTCHSGIRAATLTTEGTGIRVSHAEPLAAGMSCVTCHTDMGHRETSVNKPGMSACIRCHDGAEVSSECTMCHARDVAEASVDRLVFTPVDLAPASDCSGCHDQVSCDACHGIRMPHPQAFIDGEHARDAGFDKKRLCWRCHTQGQCGKCHQVSAKETGYWGHGPGPEWKNSHGRVPPGVQAGCGCHGRSPYARAGNYCAACH